MNGIAIASLVVSVLSLLLSAVIALFVIPVRTLKSKVETFEQQQKLATDKAIADLKVDVAKQITDAKTTADASAKILLAAYEAQAQKPIIEMSVRMQSVEQRLLAGHEHMHRLDERDHKLEVEVLKAIGELKEIVATKDDLKNLREEMKANV